MPEFNFSDSNSKIPLEESLPGFKSSFIGNAQDNKIFQITNIEGMNKRNGLPILILFEPEKPSQEE